jgi:hypothetical protein
MPNPSTDLIYPVTTPDGRHITVIMPGERLAGTKAVDWRTCEAAFIQYRPYLEEALSRWEDGRKETGFRIPPDVSPITFEKRFRDAMIGLLEQGYDPDLQRRLAACRSDICISPGPDNTIWFRQRTGKRNRRVFKPERARSEQLPSLTVSEPIINRPLQDDELHAFCLLISRGLRTLPVEFRERLTPERQSLFEESYNVAFAWDEEAGVTRLL